MLGSGRRKSPTISTLMIKLAEDGIVNWPDFVSIKFTESVYFQKWNHPITNKGPVEVARSNELNAYVSCSPGWHTFTVQQTESSINYMLLEILMDGAVVESQEV